MFNVYSIIVTYNGAKWIKKCIDSINHSTIKSHIIVIDNGSNDDTVEILKKSFPLVELIISPTNLGFGKANNIGLKKALNNGADFVLLLNQDAWIETKTIEILINQIKQNVSIGVIAPLNLTPKKQIDKTFLNNISERNFPGLISDLLINKTKAFYHSTFYINASCWLVSRKCLQNVGGFDPLFTHYGEDVDYCKRAIYHGFRVGMSTLTHEIHAKEYSNIEDTGFLDRYKKTKIAYLNSHVLFELKDMNVRFLKNYLRKSKDTLLLIVKHLLKLSFQNSLIYLILFFKIQYMVINIFFHRKKCFHKYPTFIH